MRTFSVLALYFGSIFSAGVVRSDSYPASNATHRNVWKALTAEEAQDVTTLVQTTLNLTGNFGSSRDNYVGQVTLLAPNKTDVVPYLDSSKGEPDKYARATVVFGAEELYWEEYMVGPLPVTNATKVQPLTYPFNNKQPGRTKVHPLLSASDGAQFYSKVSDEVEDITKELWNTTLADGTEIGLRYGVPFWDENGRIVSWAIVLGIPDTQLGSTTIIPQGVSIKFDLTSRNWSDWTVSAWTCKGQYYNSTEEFRSAVFSPGFEKPQPNINGPWTSTAKHGEPMPLDDLPPPVSVAQGNPRFKVDAEEDHVSWMDFDFYFSVAPDMGLALHNVQFKGKRIMYELSLQEALTHYAGSGPFSSQTVFFDTQSGMGASLVPLVKGYDCPTYATYMNATVTEGNSTLVHQDAICMFEYDAGFPIRRHTYAESASVAKNIIFTIRTIATVGNYDFLVEYHFYYDGAIEVSSRASGYISAAYWEDNPEYGFHIHDYLSGSLHDHVLTFKADLDVLGEKNSVQKVELVPESTTYPWSQGIVHNTMKAKRSFVTEESSLDWSSNDHTYYAVVNRDSPNRFGEYPGWRFRRTSGVSRLTVLNSTNTQRAATASTHDFHLTVCRATQPRAADPYNIFAPSDPLIDFSKFVQGESLEQKDVVLWFNLGMHHMPHTGDLPNTMFSATHSGMRFEPFNYLEDGDPSVAVQGQTVVNYTASAE